MGSWGAAARWGRRRHSQHPAGWSGAPHCPALGSLHAGTVNAGQRCCTRRRPGLAFQLATGPQARRESPVHGQQRLHELQKCGV